MSRDLGETDFNISFGTQWHALWPSPLIERNRKLYDFELVYFASGRSVMLFDEREVVCQPGAVVIVPPDFIHCTITHTAVERWCVHFDFYGDCPKHTEAGASMYVYLENIHAFDEACTASVPSLPGLAFPFYLEKAPSGVLPLVQRLFLTDGSTPCGTLVKKGLMLQILGELLAAAGASERTASSGTPTVNSLFRRAKNYIDCNYLMPSLSVSSIAARLSVTPNHLSKLFRYHAGMSVKAYIQTLKLNGIREALGNSRAGMAEIASKYGFEDPNYFSRLFRRHFHCSPTEYRRDATRGQEL